MDFKNIRELNGSKRDGFEELICQMAYHTARPPQNNVYHRYEGSGGDGGVECIWIRPNDDEWGWQAKYLFELKKTQLDKSVKAALKIHPNLKKYFICMPFNLTGPRRGRGKSQTEKFNEYKKEWQKLAKAKGMEVNFIFIGKSRILDFLSTNPGRFRYWSEKEVLGEEWFKEQVEAAAKSEPRYTPELSIKVPVTASLEAFGQTELWKSILKDKFKIIYTDLKEWAEDINSKEFPSVHSKDGESLRESLGKIIEILRLMLEPRIKSISLDTLEKNISTAISSALKCEEICVSDLEKKHGKDISDSEGFRQFQAEYMCVFPAQFVDSSREILKHLKELQEWFEQTNISLINSETMLILGPKGAGKTHLICDMAIDRFKRGLKSIVLFGSRFYTGEPWTQIISYLGLPTNISREEFLQTLNTVAETSRYPLIIFIDALDESKPRDIWLSYFASMIEEIKRYPWLRLCVSCRSSYYDSVIDENINIPEVIHTGFEGVEYDACFEFFKYYNLEPPSTPLMQPEFTNPLFLKLVCESLRDSGVTKLSEEEHGLSKVIHDVLEIKNKKLAKMLDFNPRERFVQKAINALVSVLIQKQSMWLIWDEAKNIIDQIRPSLNRSSSLFEGLISESVLVEEGVSGSNSENTQIRIGSECFSEYLIAKKYLERLNSKTIFNAFEKGGKLNFLVKDINNIKLHKGVLEAMAIQIPEKFGIELNQVTPKHCYNPLILKTITESLVWRTNRSITHYTQSMTRKYLGMSLDLEDAIKLSDVLLSVSTKVGNLLNVEWTNDIYASKSISVCNANLQPIWHFSYGKLGVFDRLMRWSLKADMSHITSKSAELWATQLLWFCISSDRRVRDYATKGIIRIMEGHVVLWPKIIKRFVEIDDDYMVERCMATAYGSLIRANNNDAIKKTAKVIIEVFFDRETFPLNSLIRDYARGILELASERGLLPKKQNIEKFRPPYKSNYQIEWPQKEEIEKYKDSYSELPKLYHSTFEDDFAIYTVEERYNDLKGFDKRDALCWIFKHILEMGYSSELHANFDKYILSKYGPGRSKPVWAERIGKKYQWIALYRLLGLVSDNHKDGDLISTNIPSLTAIEERNIDPTHYLKSLPETDSPQWWMNANYNFKDFDDLSDEDWLDINNDFPEVQSFLRATKPLKKDENWIILNNYITWMSKEEENGNSFDQQYRNIWIHVHSFLVQKQHFNDIWKKLKNDALSVIQGYHIPLHNEGFLGEYPWGIPYQEYFRLAKYEANDIEKILNPSVHTVKLSYEFDSFTDSESRSDLYVPSPIFFKHNILKWNGENGYADSNNKLVFEHPLPSMHEAQACISNLEYIVDFLKDSSFVLLWVILGEKSKHNGLGGKYLGYNQLVSCHYLQGEKIISDKLNIRRIRR